jgi:hypothetical protein
MSLGQTCPVIVAEKGKKHGEAGMVRAETGMDDGAERTQGRPAQHRKLVIFMALVLLVLGGLPFLRGALYIDRYEGDALHLADMVLRMAQKGQLPHLDFMTPIGVLALLPFVLMVKAGLGIGHAILAGQLAVALVLFLPVLRTARSRLTGALAYGFAFYVLLLCVALVYGEAGGAVAISMHYNRWSWALAYVALGLAVLPPLPGRARPELDGVLIGLAMAALVLIKVTYFMAFLPAIVLALVLRRQGRMLLAALLAGLAVAALVTALWGVEFWLAYLTDLSLVANSPTRAAPGLPLRVVIGGPTFLASSIALLAAVVFLRQGGRATEGLVLLVLAPAFIYVTYQNFGNDPQWLLLLALLVLQLRPGVGQRNALGWDLRQALTLTGWAALIAGFSSVADMAYSPVRALGIPAEGHVALLPAQPGQADLQIEARRFYEVRLMRQGDEAGGPYAAYAKDAQPGQEAMLNGTALPRCQLDNGYGAWFDQAAKDLTAAGYHGSKMLAADLFNQFWLFGDFEPVPGAAPWYYAGVPGLAQADYLVVPLCPVDSARRRTFLEAVSATGWELQEIRRTETYVLLKPVSHAQPYQAP